MATLYHDDEINSDADGIKGAKVWAEIEDLSESHICGWEDNKIEVPAIYDEETETYAIQTTALNITSWHQPDHKYAITLYARDEAGNVASCGIDSEEYGDQLGIRVKEKDAPTIAFASGFDMYTSSSIDLPLFKFCDGGIYEFKDDAVIDTYDPFVTLDQCKPRKESSGLNLDSVKWYLDGTEFFPKALREEYLGGGNYDYVEEDLVFKVWGGDPPPSFPAASGTFEEGYGYFVSSDSFETGESGVTISDLSAGQHVIKVTIEDNDGNLAECEHSFIVHMSAPYIECILPTYNYEDYFITNNSLIHVKFRVHPHEDGTPIDHVSIYGIDVSLSQLGEPDDNGWYIYETDIQLDTEYSEYDYAEKQYLSNLSDLITMSVTDIYGNSTSITRKVVIDTSKPWFEDVHIDEQTLIAGQDKVTIRFKLYDLPMNNSKNVLFNYRSVQINPISSEEPSSDQYLEVSGNTSAKIKYAITANTRRAVDFALIETNAVNDENLQTGFSITTDPNDPHTKIVEALNETYFSYDSAYRYNDHLNISQTKNSWKIPITIVHNVYGDMSSLSGTLFPNNQHEHNKTWKVNGYMNRDPEGTIVVRDKGSKL